MLNAEGVGGSVTNAFLMPKVCLLTIERHFSNTRGVVVSICPVQIDQLKQELSKKESELLALQTKLETLNNQNSDCKQHIEVLKESLTAKEQRAAILQTEVRGRLSQPPVAQRPLRYVWAL